MFDILFLDKFRSVAETNSSSAHVFEYDWPEGEVSFKKLEKEITEFLKTTGGLLLPHPQGEFNFEKDCYIWKKWQSKYNFLWLISPYVYVEYNHDVFEEMEKLFSEITGMKIKYPDTHTFFKYLKLYNGLQSLFPYNYEEKFIDSYFSIYFEKDVFLSFLENGVIVNKGFDGDPCPKYKEEEV